MIEGSMQLNDLFTQTFQIIRYKTEFDWCINCGDIDGANRVLRQLSSYLTLQGCDCGCGENQESGEPTIINATVTVPNLTNLLIETAVTTEVISPDTSITVSINGANYKLDALKL